MPADPDLPAVFTRAEAIGAGLSRHQIAQRVRSGRWKTLRRGVYTVHERYAALPAREQHLLSVIAVLITRGEGVLASHLSAAVVHGWALPLEGAGPATVTCGELDSPTRRTAAFVVQVASLAPADCTTVAVRAAEARWELRATSRARTVADVLRHLTTPDGVAVGDSALREGRVRHDQVASVLERQATWPFVERGRKGLMLLDPRRETWLESYSFVRLHQLGLVMPEPQVSLFDRHGTFVARVDGWLDDEAVALEADGREKYFLRAAPLPADADLAAEELLGRARRVVVEEKTREDRLRDLGVQVARWGTNDITRHPKDVLARIGAARTRGDRARFTGRTAYLPRPSWLAPPPRSLLSSGRFAQSGPLLTPEMAGGTGSV